MAAAAAQQQQWRRAGAERKDNCKNHTEKKKKVIEPDRLPNGRDDAPLAAPSPCCCRGARISPRKQRPQLCCGRSDECIAERGRCDNGKGGSSESAGSMLEQF